MLMPVMDRWIGLMVLGGLKLPDQGPLKQDSFDWMDRITGAG